MTDYGFARAQRDYDNAEPREDEIEEIEREEAPIILIAERVRKISDSIADVNIQLALDTIYDDLLELEAYTRL